ncbi:penicillin-binding protein 1A [Oleidesulfovibrio sp.]|uniref:penicillin-binding protein 1A n=1 Tax=Oleidesulfovibrio sp. TaxID=2909707 RepID=UPI003A8C888C
MNRTLTYFLIGLLSLVLLGILGLGGIYVWATKDLPGFTRITDYRPPLVTTVYARDNSTIGYFYREKRFLARLDEMPSHLPLAFLAAEDDSFYRHEGIDFRAIMRAFMKNMQAGSIRQGGSTITQQVIKRLLLTSERSYERKIKEAILAYRLERYLSKDEILTIYLNQIYLGAGAYGVESAARTYFGKHVGELTIAEAALLAGLPQAPSKYNPLNNPEAAFSRQLYVLQRMLALGWITSEQYDTAINEEMVFTSMKDPSWGTGSWYLEEVRRRLIEYLSEDNMEKQGIKLERYGEDAVYESGLHVYTTMEPKHQAAAEEALRQGLIDSTKRRGWRGPLEHLEAKEAREAFLQENPVAPETLVNNAWVKVLVTNVSQKGADVSFGEYSGFMDVESMHWCRTPDPKVATDFVAAVKDARTVVKAGDVVWAQIVLPENDKKDAEPAQFTADTKFKLAIAQEPDVQGALVSIEPDSGDVVALVGGYSFAESQYNRAVQAKRQPGSAFKPIVYSTALDNGYTPASIVLDAPFVYTDDATAKIWRPENFSGKFYGPTLLRTALVKSRNLCTIRIAQAIGIPPIVERAKALGFDAPFPFDLSVSLGSVAVSPLNLTEVYTAFAHEGMRAKHRMVTSIKSAWDEPIATFEPEQTEAISPQNAYIMASLMKEVVRDGTGFRAKVLKRPLGGKTGTSNDERDAWFVLISPYLVTVSYVGFDDLTPMGKWETGSRAASPIVVDYRRAVEEDYPVQDFPMPPGIVQVRIDGNTGNLAGPASSLSYFLPFKEGTQPTIVEGSAPRHGADDSKSGEDLMKQMF